ncbi:hypothetical protein SELMODRAFT_413917 [Selaginella moellendorffii]|uniref:Uncharacterized protein n=1 Tax=Selaginella moellendorffii TaxID=88036 RepID=D8RR16_SELML|nr:hypothetical protein SELMODRAFT_413917 [Selaginella moellendorffii]
MVGNFSSIRLEARMPHASTAVDTMQETPREHAAKHSMFRNWYSQQSRTSTPTASHPQLLTAFEQAERRLTLHTLQHMQNLQHVSFSSPSLESSSPRIRNEQVRTPHAHGVVQSGMLPPTLTTGRAHGIPYSATATSPATPPTTTTLATPSTSTSANTWPSTSRSNKLSSSPSTAQHAFLLSLQASGIQPSSMTNPGAFVQRARQFNGGEAHTESAKFGLSSIRPCYWPPQTSWGAIANKANGNQATEPNPYENNEEEDSADEEDILPLPEETLPIQDNMDISGVKEQSDGGDEPHQGSPETSLSPEIVAPGHAADRPMVVYDSDGRGLEDHGVPPPPFLEGSSSTPFTLMELLDNFFTVDANFIMLQIEEVSTLQDATTTLEVQWLKHKLLGCFGVESTSDEEMLDTIARHPEFHWVGDEIFLRRVLFNQTMPHWQDWESLLLKFGLSEAQYKDVFCDNTIQQLLAEVSINVPPSILESTIAWFIEKRDLHRNWAAAQQLRELFDTTKTPYCKFSHFCIEKAMLRPYRLACTRLRPSRILIAPNNEFSCFQFAFNTNLRTPNYKVVYASEIGGALVWEESTIDAGKEPHIGILRCQCILGHCNKKSGMWFLTDVQLQHWQLQLERFQTRMTDDLPEEDYMRWTSRHAHCISGMHSTNCEVFWVRTIIPHAEFINCLIFDQDFGENFRSWIVDIIRDISLKELSKFHHFVVDSSKFRLGEPIWIQVERQSTSST